MHNRAFKWGNKTIKFVLHSNKYCLLAFFKYVFYITLYFSKTHWEILHVDEA